MLLPLYIELQDVRIKNNRKIFVLIVIITYI